MATQELLMLLDQATVAALGLFAHEIVMGLLDLLALAACTDLLMPCVFRGLCQPVSIGLLLTQCDSTCTMRLLHLYPGQKRLNKKRVPVDSMALAIAAKKQTVSYLAWRLFSSTVFLLQLSRVMEE